jgi:hypothetical protein
MGVGYVPLSICFRRSFEIKRRRDSAYISFQIRKGIGYYAKRLRLKQRRSHLLLNSEVAGSAQVCHRHLAP